MTESTPAVAETAAPSSGGLSLDQAFERVQAARAAEAGPVEVPEEVPPAAVEEPEIEAEEPEIDDPEADEPEEEAEVPEIDLAQSVQLQLDDGRVVEATLADVAEAAARAVTLVEELRTTKEQHRQELVDRTARAQQVLGTYLQQVAAVLVEGAPDDSYFLERAAVVGPQAAAVERNWWMERAGRANELMRNAEQLFTGAAREEAEVIQQQRAAMFNRLAADLARDEPAYRDPRVVQQETALIERHLQERWNYTADETGAITDPRVYRIVRENLLMRQHIAAARKATRAAQPLPKSGKPSGSGTGSTAVAARKQFAAAPSIETAVQLQRALTRKG